MRDIRRSGAHLLELINDILDLSRLDQDQAQLREEDLNLEDAVDAAFARMPANAHTEQLIIERRISADLPRLRADRRRVTQVLANLLSNAVKFTPAGGRVSLSAFLVGNELAIAIADTGIGIAAEDIPKAFERFRQIDSRLSRKFEGSGLGLPLARQFMELHGGRLVLESAPGKGTTATVYFPQARLERSATIIKLASHNHR